MVISGKFTYLNSEIKQGVKDPTKNYHYVLLMQGTETLQCMTDADTYNISIPQLDKFSDVNCVFDFNPVFKSLRLVSID